MSSRGYLAPAAFGQLHAQMVDSIAEFGVGPFAGRSKPQRSRVVCYASEEGVGGVRTKVLEKSRSTLVPSRRWNQRHHEQRHIGAVPVSVGKTYQTLLNSKRILP